MVQWNIPISWRLTSHLENWGSGGVNQHQLCAWVIRLTISCHEMLLSVAAAAEIPLARYREPNQAVRTLHKRSRTRDSKGSYVWDAISMTAYRCLPYWHSHNVKEKSSANRNRNHHQIFAMSTNPTRIKTKSPCSVIWWGFGGLASKIEVVMGRNCEKWHRARKQLGGHRTLVFSFQMRRIHECPLFFF